MHTECRFPEFCVWYGRRGMRPCSSSYSQRLHAQPSTQRLPPPWCLAELCAVWALRFTLLWQLFTSILTAYSVSLKPYIPGAETAWGVQGEDDRGCLKLRAPQLSLSSASSFPFCLSLPFPQQTGLRPSEGCLGMSPSPAAWHYPPPTHSHPTPPSPAKEGKRAHRLGAPLEEVMLIEGKNIF